MLPKKNILQRVGEALEPVEAHIAEARSMADQIYDGHKPSISKAMLNEIKRRMAERKEQDLIELKEV